MNSRIPCGKVERVIALYPRKHYISYMTENNEGGKVSDIAIHLMILQDEFYSVDTEELLKEVATEQPEIATYIRNQMAKCESDSEKRWVGSMLYAVYGTMQFIHTSSDLKDKTTGKVLPLIETTKPLPKEWSYEIYREYLLALTKGKDFLLRSAEYPDIIELDLEWHKTLDQMRRESADGIERWTAIGFSTEQTRGRRAIYLPTMLAKGLPDHVPGEVILESLKQLSGKGIIGPIGEIHSHPRDLLFKIWGIPIPDPFLAPAVFSAGDLYNVLLPGKFQPLTGVVQGNENLFAFRTKETKDIGIDPLIFTQEQFERYWYERNGFRYLGGVKEYGANRAIPISASANSWNVNQGIATRHNLVLYRGRSGGNLIKVAA